MPKPAAKSKANPRTLLIGGVIVAALAVPVIWLNFGRGERGPDAEALDAARRAADDMAANQIQPDPKEIPVPAPARPSSMGR